MKENKTDANEPQGLGIGAWLKKWFQLTMDLGKIRITFSVTITTTIGYLLAPAPWVSGWVWPVLGILMIGLASAALNQLQDHELDAKMRRTRWRPLPSGRVTRKQVAGFVIFYLTAGTAILYFKTNATATILGLSAFFWYNGIYTYLKRVSAIAVIPGSVIGGVPPAVGWAAAGGDIWDPYILSICLFMFIWQIPHFWLLLFMYGDDYSLAGLPNLLDKVSEYGLRLMTFAGIIITACSAFWIPIAGGIHIKMVYRALAFLSIFLVWFSRNLATRKGEISYKQAFISINIYSVLVLVVVLVAEFARSY